VTIAIGMAMAMAEKIMEKLMEKLMRLMGPCSLCHVRLANVQPRRRNRYLLVPWSLARSAEGVRRIE